MVRFFFSLLLLLNTVVLGEEGDEDLLERHFPTGTRWRGTAMLSYKARKEQHYSFSDTENNAFSAAFVLGNEQWMTKSIGLG